MMKQMASLISKILSPYIVAVLTIIIVSYKASEQNIFQTLKWSGLGIGLIIGIPFLYILLKVKSGKLTDLHVRVRKQRHAIYVIGTISVSFCFIFMLYLNAPKLIIAMLTAVIISNAVNFTINSFWKVSIHSAAIAGTSVFFYIFWGLPAFMALLFLLTLVGWSRVALKEHSIGQVVAGALIAGITTLLVLKAFGF